ncbi:hypothetical protein GCM10010236_65580 [Streptomyces eurythermus]|nr:hypothetical protein GCM10010236_65580 [Streptomyces eurythermus]
MASVTRGDVQFDAVHEGGHGGVPPKDERGFTCVNTRKADPPSRPGSEVRLAKAFSAESGDQTIW